MIYGLLHACLAANIWGFSQGFPELRGFKFWGSCKNGIDILYHHAGVGEARVEIEKGLTSH